MAVKKRGLGKGLGALLGDAAVTDTAVDVETLITGQTPSESKSPTEVPIEYLQPGRYQPRTDIDSDQLQELASSIKEHGIVQPIVIRQLAVNRYEIIAGERRWRAAQLAGLHEVPVIIRVLSDQDTLAVALIENIQREDLNVMEEAEAYQRLSKEFDVTHQHIAQIVGKSRAAVTNIMRLMDLHHSVQALLREKSIDMGHARALLAVDQDSQAQLAKQVVKNNLTVRATEQIVKRHLSGKDQPDNTTKVEKDPDIVRLENQLSEQLGTETKIQYAADGKGKLVINFHDLDHLQGVLARISS
ncbi:MAG: ParB/RepB/Spo0J family partition protein [Gammaproteobacteria bacterium]|nr:ParB/RepB/Spo0J family partition protein [Gammaproteobacteria bacterium]